ncbi:hypothetical protein HNQ02_000473 [Flavobacterium sp. 7E]|uniref:hypothetical protein n=1 Tax=Flavobacterium sp. 7E TaxID=2735898 RepID=UPI00156EE532|nr:hypothetical protein [Flavobacterium sp. 7E]NRS87566.1 hypothetical protein [Flavobacterium sp. 7E]
MNQKKKKYIIQNLKWPINHYEFSSNYLFAFFPLCLIFVGITEFEREDSCTVLLSGIIFLIFVIYRIETEKKFTELTFKKDLSTIEIGKLLVKNGWILRNQFDGTLELTTNKGNFYQGENVTIIRTKIDKILINTQPSGRAPFTFFKVNINYHEIRKILEM